MGREDFYLNTYSSVKYKNAVPRAARQTTQIKEPPMESSSIVEEDEPILKKPKLEEEILKPCDKPPVDGKGKSKPSATLKTKKSSPKKSSKTKPNGGIANMFAKQKEKIAKEPEKKVESPENSPGKENLINEQNAETKTKCKQPEKEKNKEKSSTSKKRKRIQ